MTNKTETGGYMRFSGQKIFDYSQAKEDKGILIPEQEDIKPEPKYKSLQWYAKKPSVIESEKEQGIEISESKWLKRRVRDNQYGLKASEAVHGIEWYPVSNVVDEEQLYSKLYPEDYNIQASTFRYGQAVFSKNVSKDKKVLQRAPNDFFYTQSQYHNDQTIYDPSGVVSGIEGLKLK